MIRTAISPRLATRTRRKGGAAPASLRKDGRAATGAADPPRTVPTGRSERDVAMLLPGIRVPLAGQHLEGADEPWPRLGRADDVIDVAARRGDVGVRELRLVFRHQSLVLRRRVVGCGDGVLEDDVNGALGAHDRDLGRGP